MTKTVIIYSGGLDSTTLLYSLKAQGRDIKALGINYGQRHSNELVAAKNICDRLGVEYRVADLSSIKPLLAGSSQTDSTVEVPEGHYAAENMKLTVVPNRNMIMLAVAGAWAISSKADTIAYAAHAGDHTIYPDCREEFVDNLNKALGLADWHSVTIERPFIHLTKGQVVKLGADLKVPYEMTWSCYKGGDTQCGACGTCVERREAFVEAGVTDPTQYKISFEETKRISCTR
jgi:7-cyano-7-deazaguanine synthase